MVHIKKNRFVDTNLLDPSLLKRSLQTRFIGKNILAFNKLASTNKLAKRLAKKGTAEGSLVIAEQQTRGKGRLSRQWYSPPKLGLWFSIVLYPKNNYEYLGLTSLLASVSVAEAVEELTALKPTLKWPNDVLVNGKKLAGILLETEFSHNELTFLILGVGINVNQTITDFPIQLRSQATSLHIESGILIERTALLAQILKNLEENYTHFVTGGFNRITEKWKMRCPLLKNKVSFQQNEQNIDGIFEDLNSQGSMLVRFPSGEIKCIHTSE